MIWPRTSDRTGECGRVGSGRVPQVQMFGQSKIHKLGIATAGDKRRGAGRTIFHSDGVSPGSIGSESSEYLHHPRFDSVNLLSGQGKVIKGDRFPIRPPVWGELGVTL